jgi:ubiquinone/menaquinone biosynthesis C-methylase UbiE
VTAGQHVSNELIGFWSAAAPDYDRVVELQVGPGTRAKVRERLSQQKSLGDVVEFGCGSGFFTPVLARNAARVLATDFSPGMLGHAEECIRAANVTFQIEDCQASSLEDESFDTAFLGLVLQFADHERTIAEMRRVLKPGGRLLIANLDVLALALPHRMRCLFRVVHQGRSGYRVRPPRRFGKNVIGERDLCKLLERTGFGILSSETVTNASRPYYIPINYLRAEKDPPQ